MAGTLITEQKIAFAVGALAMSHGIKIEHVHTRSWRAKLCRRWSGNMDGDKDIPRVIAASYSNWPLESNDHTRDAGGILLYGRIPSESKRYDSKGNVNASSPRERLKESAAMVAVRKAAMKERAREAAGCRCQYVGNQTKLRHVRGCPLRKPGKVPEWAEKALE